MQKFTLYDQYSEEWRLDRALRNAEILRQRKAKKIVRGVATALLAALAVIFFSIDWSALSRLFY